ncbi:MAG: helix-turn-helix domain-containing protein [Ruminococcus sp.]|nr:helix-turn-helix domain-containing protein [Ruminococcus sp.]
MRNLEEEAFEKKWKNEFSKTLDNLLKKRKKSINQLAAETNIDSKTIRNYISGKSIPTATLILKIADVLDVDVDYLITGGKTGHKYLFSKKIYELAVLIKNLDIKLNNIDQLDDGNYQSVSVTINDPVLAPIIIELCMTPEKDFISHVEKIISKYNNMEKSDQHFADYAIFQNLIKDRYIFDGYDAMDNFTADDEIEERREKWEEMSPTERENWWRNWLKEHGLIN